ncbi:MAG TPA: hypothetical protein VHL57_06845, partial [Flavobacteriales bacterium]|nr:hypothetical protein [Flavobacteriales bacterium]
MAGRRFREHDAPKGKLTKAAWGKARRVFRYMRPYRTQQLLGMFCLVCTSLLSMVFPVLVGKLVDAHTGTTGFWSAPITDLTNIDSVAKLLLLTFALQAV